MIEKIQPKITTNIVKYNKTSATPPQIPGEPKKLHKPAKK